MCIFRFCFTALTLGWTWLNDHHGHGVLSAFIVDRYTPQMIPPEAFQANLWAWLPEASAGWRSSWPLWVSQSRCPGPSSSYRHSDFPALSSLSSCVEPGSLKKAESPDRIFSENGRPTDQFKFTVYLILFEQNRWDSHRILWLDPCVCKKDSVDTLGWGLTLCNLSHFFVVRYVSASSHSQRECVTELPCCMFKGKEQPNIQTLIHQWCSVKSVHHPGLIVVSLSHLSLSLISHLESPMPLQFNSPVLFPSPVVPIHVSSLVSFPIHLSEGSSGG